MSDYDFVVSHESGQIKPGSSLEFQLMWRGSLSDVPKEAITWRTYHNGEVLNFLDFSQLVVAQDLHTRNQPKFGFQLRPEVRGIISVEAVGEKATEMEGVRKRWRYEIAEQAEPAAPEPVTKQDLLDLEERIVQRLSALLQ